ncbi:MAG: hypothetical protein ABH863_01210 [Candidatus Micrarchaeota archaeon]
MRMIRASSPTKAIIAGEHSVVYGGTALAVPLSNKKRCICEVREGSGSISVDDSAGIGKYLPDGSFEDADGWFAAKARLIEHILKSEKAGLEGHEISLTFSKNRIPKGTGHSAATAACMALCLFEAFGRLPAKEKLFEAVQAFEAVAHAGIPSGIDAQTVLSDRAVKFRKDFSQGGNAKPRFEEIALELPSGTSLLLVDTLLGGQSASTTAQMLEKFAAAKGIGKKPAEMAKGERRAVIKKFDEIVGKVEAELFAGGNAQRLGMLLNENHALLRENGVSSEGIDEAVRTALQSGALGAKISGAGGIGGAVLALCQTVKVGGIIGSLEEIGMHGVRAEISTKGACLDPH